MERKVLWIFVVALLLVNIAMLVQRRRFAGRFENLRREAGFALLKSAYAEDEEILVTSTKTVPATFPLLEHRGEHTGSVQFLLLASVDDCTNCIEDEVAQLNQVAVKASEESLTGIQGFFVDEDRIEMAQRFIAFLSPPPIFPVTVRNTLSQLPEAQTPLVLVIRSRDGKILDAHRPIPEDLAKRDAFYTRWQAALELN